MSEDPVDRRAALLLSSGGRPWLILLRGHWGMVIDRFMVRTTGLSPITLQYALARGDRYQPTLLLTVTGKRSGLPRRHAMAYFKDHGSLIVVGSHGGSPHDPDWIWNLRAEPRASVTVRLRNHSVVARFATGQERARLFEEIVAERPNVGRYQDRAGRSGRLLPLVILTRLDGRPLP